MALKPLVLSLCAAFSNGSRKAPKPPPDMEARARAEFALCYRQSAKDMKDCAYGGCGNILGQCYERELGVILTDTDKRLATLHAGRCRVEADSLESAHAAWQYRLEHTRSFQDTWADQELQIETALLRNHALKALQEHCGKANVPRP